MPMALLWLLTIVLPQLLQCHAITQAGPSNMQIKYIDTRALVDKGFCVSTCRLALNVMTCRYVLSLNICNFCRCYSSCQQGNLYVHRSFIPKCHDISTHIVVNKSTNRYTRFGVLCVVWVKVFVGFMWYINPYSSVLLSKHIEAETKWSPFSNGFSLLCSV